MFFSLNIHKETLSSRIFKALLWNRNDFYYGSGSGSRQYLIFFQQQQKTGPKSRLFNVRSSIISQKGGLSVLIIDFLFHFMLDPDPNPAPEPEP